MEVRQQAVGDFELEAGMDEDVRAASRGDDTTMIAGNGLQGAQGGGADGDERSTSPSSASVSGRNSSPSGSVTR
jgi:hypothetical protein